MLRVINVFVEEDFEEYNQEVDILKGEREGDYVFSLTTNRNINLDIILRVDDNTSLEEIRRDFIEGLRILLRSSQAVYHEYELFLSRLVFKQDMEFFKYRTRNKLRETAEEN